MARRDGWAALFWSAFKDSRNAMVLLDEHRRHVDVNGAYLRLAGYARDEVMGRPVWEYIEGGPQLTEASGSWRSRAGSSAARPDSCVRTGRS